MIWTLRIDFLVNDEVRNCSLEGEKKKINV